MEKIPLIIFLFYTIPASIIPLMIGLVILIISRRERLIILAGLLTLKSFFEGIVSYLMMSNGIGYKYGYVGVIEFGILPPLLISFILLIIFRQTINKNGNVSLILFGLDAIRWFISSFFPWWFGISAEGFGSIWYLALCFQMLFPSVSAVIALAIVINRKMVLSKAQKKVVSV